MSVDASMTPEELSERLWRFAARIGKVVDALPDTRLGRHVAGQLVRCGSQELIKILGKSIGTAKSNRRRNHSEPANDQFSMPNDQ